MDKKTKHKLILFTVLFFIGIALSLVISEYIYSMIARFETTWIDYLPHFIIGSIIKNKLHAMMFLSVTMTILMIVILIMNMGSGENYTSELDKITDTILTPKKVGQSQHGSARWLTEKEKDKVFTAYTIDRNNNPTIRKLLNEGNKEKKEVV